MRTLLFTLLLASAALAQTTQEDIESVRRSSQWVGGGNIGSYDEHVGKFVSPFGQSPDEIKLRPQVQVFRPAVAEKSILDSPVWCLLIGVGVGVVSSLLVIMVIKVKS